MTPDDHPGAALLLLAGVIVFVLAMVILSKIVLT